MSKILGNVFNPLESTSVFFNLKKKQHRGEWRKKIGFFQAFFLMLFLRLLLFLFSLFFSSVFFCFFLFFVEVFSPRGAEVCPVQTMLKYVETKTNIKSWLNMTKKKSEKRKKDKWDSILKSFQHVATFFVFFKIVC